MEIVIAVVFSLLFAVVFKGAIKKVPWLFYLIAVVAVILFMNHVLLQAAPQIGRILFPYMQRCLVAFGLFCVVMFIGAFSDKSRFRRHLMPIRGELSIIASILTVGHILNYLNSYIQQFLEGFTGMSFTMITSFVISALLMVLLALLAITSFNTIRKNMKRDTWKKIQVLAYPFFILIYFHLVLILGMAGEKGLVSVIIYSVIMAAYVVLRVRKVLADKKATVMLHEQQSATS